MRKIIKNFFKLCFPSGIYCIACDNLTDETRTYSLCDRCIKEIDWNVGKTCSKCGKALENDYEQDLCYDCQNANHVFRRGYSCVTYNGWAKKIVQNMKYKDKSYIAEQIAEIMKDRSIDTTSSLLIPVPMNIIKKNKRGYNQAELIATILSKKTGIPCDSKALSRNKKSVAMSSLGRDNRKLNLRDEFCVSDEGKKVIKNQEVILVDDVFTTGSTANACAEALLMGGARAVDVFVFASGGNLKVT